MFTVIVPVYQPENVEHLKRNLKLLAKFAQVHELYVMLIDDGSDDREYLSEIDDFKFVRIYINEKNIGKAQSINKIIEYIKTDYVAILDDDDLLTEKGIVERINYINTEGGDLFIGAMKVMNNNEVNEVRHVPKGSKTELITQLLSGFRTPFHSNAVLFKKELFKRVGGMHPDLIRVQDVDLSVKLLTEGSSLTISNTIHYIYYKHRSDYKSIFQLRLKTMFYRFKMIFNNTAGLRRYYHLLKSFLIDSLKFMYAIVYRY
jgi:glycosyltransferase involved in cell wall biosynthesis